MSRAAALEVPGNGARRAALAGLGANLVGVGLARFAYTPLIPALIAAGWFAPSAAAYLGAANLFGYLAGALVARRLARACGAAAALRAMLLLATAAFFACAVPLSFAWYFAWRFAAGVAGGVLMALAAPTALSLVPAARRGLAGGAIFTGVGLGIAASGTLVPLLMRAGLVETWCGLGVLSAMVTALSWGGWPPQDPAAGGPPEPAPSAPRLPAVRALYVEYALNAAGLVPHMIFLADFVARGLGRGLAVAGQYWVLFGLGACLGPLIGGRLADRLGFRAMLRLAFVVQILGIGLLAVAAGGIALALSSLVVGALVPGVVPLVLGRVHELLPAGEARQRAWGWCTIAFALGQAAGAYLFSWLYAARAGGYPLLFALGAAAVAAALAIDMTVAGRRRA